MAKTSSVVASVPSASFQLRPDDSSMGRINGRNTYAAGDRLNVVYQFRPARESVLARDGELCMREHDASVVGRAVARCDACERFLVSASGVAQQVLCLFAKLHHRRARGKNAVLCVGVGVSAGFVSGHEISFQCEPVSARRAERRSMFDLSGLIQVDSALPADGMRPETHSYPIGHADKRQATPWWPRCV